MCSTPSCGCGPYRESLVRADLNHAPEQRLAVGGDEVGHVEHPTLHLLQQLAQVVMVKRQRPLQEGKREGERERDRERERERDGKRERQRERWKKREEGCQKLYLILTDTE